MMERYSHIRMEAKRRAVDDLSGTDFEPGVAQNWAQFFVSEKENDPNLLKTSGEPGRTRTCNPLIKRPSETGPASAVAHFTSSYHLQSEPKRPRAWRSPCSVLSRPSALSGTSLRPRTTSYGTLRAIAALASNRKGERALAPFFSLEERPGALLCFWVKAVCQDNTFTPSCQISGLSQYPLEPTLV